MEMLRFSSVLLNVWVLGHNRLQLGEILNVQETHKWFYELENVIRASLDIRVSSKWVTFQF